MLRHTRLCRPHPAALAALCILTPLTAQAGHPPIKVPAGFQAEMVYAVPKQQGSWVSLTTADRGRLIACNQYGKLYRIKLPDSDGAAPQVEELKVKVGRAQGLLYAFDSLYVMGKQEPPPRKPEDNTDPQAGKDEGRKKQRPKPPPPPSGLFRLRDTNGDDQFDAVEHLIQLRVGGEHHAHAIVLSPDGKSLYICGGNMTQYPKPDFSSARMPRNFKGDHIIERMPDARGHNTGALPLGGWIARISPDGKQRELIANGFRNQYDIAFSTDGELFTYDSDMEWDIGTAWYRPTRINHVVSGAEYGWRYGSGKWPDYYADSLGAVIDVGPGSPTGVTFGTGAKFPARYQRALFAADWSYGVIYAVHLNPSGASYSAEKEAFAMAAPFPVTDMVVRPDDGALYFAVGGRGARSALYRIRYTGDDATARIAEAASRGSKHQLRRRLERAHGAGITELDGQPVVAAAWPHLGDEDRHIRYAARLAIEHRPVAEWRSRVLAETQPRRLIHGAIALARHGSPTDLEPLVSRLSALDWPSSTAVQLEWLRALGLAFSRLGLGGAELRGQLARKLDAVFPGADPFVNRELCRLLCHLDTPAVIGKALELLDAAPSQEEQMHYAYCLRVVTWGWSMEQRRRYLKWFDKAAGYRGGASFQGFCRNIRKDAIKRMPEQVQQDLAELIKRAPKRADVTAVAIDRKFVKAWQVADLEQAVAQKTKGHDFARGRRLYGEAACARCHRFAGEGGAVGPDLTSVGGRFGVREILEAILEPSKVISDQYEATIFEKKNGDFIVGYVANYAGGNIKVVQDMFEPGKFTNIKVTDLKSQKPSPVSMMPPGLIYTLDKEEVQDLVAYLRSRGDARHPLFQK